MNTTSKINTRAVSGRRTVRFESMHDLMSDAENMAADANVETVGNWSLGQIFVHLARTMNDSIDGMSIAFPAPVRWLMRLLMKKKFLTRSIPPGFRTGGAYEPPPTSTSAGLKKLRQAINRQENESKRAHHPGLGALTRDEWTQFHLRHAELHMSFARPSES